MYSQQGPGPQPGQGQQGCEGKQEDAAAEDTVKVWAGPPPSPVKAHILATRQNSKLPPVVRGHDIFNLVYLAVLNTLNVLYLMGVIPDLILTLASLLYFLVDMCYIGCWPRCVNSPLVILGHHVLAMLLILIPYHYPKYTWCLSYCMLVEVNTWLLIAKRTFARAGDTMEALFLGSWVLLRNVWYPYLVLVFGREWRLEAAARGTPWNPVLAAPIFQAFLTGLNCHWTWQLWVKRRQGVAHKQL